MNCLYYIAGDRHAYPLSFSFKTDWAAASLATGTLNGEQET